MRAKSYYLDKMWRVRFEKPLSEAEKISLVEWAKKNNIDIEIPNDWLRDVTVGNHTEAMMLYLTFS